MIRQISARTSFEPASNQLRTSSEPTSVMEFGFYGAIVHEKGSWELCTAAVGLCWTQDAPVHRLVERQKSTTCY